MNIHQISDQNGLLKKHPQLGFTLIELLLALGISAIIALGTYRLFNVSVTTRSTLVEQSEQQSQLFRAMQVIERDLHQFTPRRPVQDAFGDSVTAIDFTENTLSLTRNGWQNSPLLPYERSQLQRVRYQLIEQGLENCPTLNDQEPSFCLLRSYQAHLDDDGALTWFNQRLMQGVQALTWRFYLQNNTMGTAEFYSRLPEEDARTGELSERLIAIELNLTTLDGRTYTRLLHVPALPSDQTEANGQ